MAFDLQHLGKWSVTMNASATNEWGYNGAPLPPNDSVTDILTDGYFNAVANTHLKFHDLIHVTATDGTFTAQVTALSPDVTLKETVGSSFAVIKFIANKISTTTPAIQNFPEAGVLSSDFIFAQANILNSSTAVIARAQTFNGSFTIEFNVAPGFPIDFSALIVRAL